LSGCITLGNLLKIEAEIVCSMMHFGLKYAFQKSKFKYNHSNVQGIHIGTAITALC